MLTNEQFLEVIRNSFKKYLEIDTSRSPVKLNNLHGYIAKDLQEIFGPRYDVESKGFGNGKEKQIKGRYYPKNVDISICQNGIPIAGYAVKFVMRNYSQNSNNYFENMLGETANIRANSIPYFQIFIIFEKVPYYKSNREFQKYDIVTEHNFEKYFALSKDNPNLFFHTPDKTLIVLLSIKEKSPNYQFKDSRDYADYYKTVIEDADLLGYSNKIKDLFDNSVLLNDYQRFIQKTHLIVEGKMK